MLFVQITPLCFAQRRSSCLICSARLFHNALRKSDIDWMKILPYAPSQGSRWESMIKLLKNALYRTVENTRRLPSLIELQTFASDTVRIVNDRLLTKPSDL